MIEQDDRRFRRLDANGFLTNPAHWDAHLATQIARRLRISELTVAHWRVIERLRTTWLRDGRMPVQRLVCRELNLVCDCVNKLFGGLMEAWMVAGLPDPGDEARAYMDYLEREVQKLIAN